MKFYNWQFTAVINTLSTHVNLKIHVVNENHQGK